MGNVSHYSNRHLVRGGGLNCTAPERTIRLQYRWTSGTSSQLRSTGVAYSNENTYLTMNTSQGSFALTDAGANIGMSVTDKFHVGAQLYLRNIGPLGKWRPDLDWAYAGYKSKDWLGVRGGKVKTALGLYNDTRTLNFFGRGHSCRNRCIHWISAAITSRTWVERYTDRFISGSWGSSAAPDTSALEPSIRAVGTTIFRKIKVFRLPAFRAAQKVAICDGNTPLGRS